MSEPRRRPREWTPPAVRAARGLLNWSSERLAHQSGLEIEAVELFEAGDDELAASDLHRLDAALRRAGVVPVRAARAGEGVRFRHPQTPQGQIHGIARRDD